MANWYVIEGRYVDGSYSDILRPIGLVDGRQRAEAVLKKLHWKFEQADFYCRPVDEIERKITSDEVVLTIAQQRGIALFNAAVIVSHWNRELPPEPGKVADCGDSTVDNQTLRQKTEDALEIIRGNGPIQGKNVASRIEMSAATFRRHVVPELKKLGVKNKRGSGYYIP